MTLVVTDGFGGMQGATLTMFNLEKGRQPHCWADRPGAGTFQRIEDGLCMGEKRRQRVGPQDAKHMSDQRREVQGLQGVGLKPENLADRLL
eukprot:1155616-Pelagomonas_calceolata.AAC.1